VAADAWLTMRLIDGRSRSERSSRGRDAHLLQAAASAGQQAVRREINSHWPYLLEYARGEPSCWTAVSRPARIASSTSRKQRCRRDRRVVIAAVALPRRPCWREHWNSTPSSAVTAVRCAADARLADAGNRAASERTRVRRDIARIAVEPSVLWIDVQARADILNFYNFIR